jgi:hypothetical protein
LSSIRASASVLFATGVGAVYGAGLYATHIAPEDAESVETIIVHCFGGDATPPEVSYGIALAITDGHRSFVEVGDGWQWMLPTPNLGYLAIETMFCGAVLWDGREWRLAHESDT